MAELIYGQYRVTGTLGMGGVAIVYDAAHEILGRQVAIKVLRPQMSAQRDLVRRFFQEAQAAARIEHPSIVAILDVGYSPAGEAYIVMEKLAGETLRSRLKRCGPLPMTEALTIVRQVADAVGAAHQAGIVHRDLKPDNLFLIADPQAPSGERIKVLDFGFAKLLGPGNGSMLTTQGMVFGTPAYMAPEQCLDAGKVDARADLYAIGCILYHCLCGEPPFGTTGGDVLDMLGAQLNQEPVPPRVRRPEVPEALDALVVQLLAKSPGQRPPSCAVLLAALEKIAAAAATQDTDTGYFDHDVTILDAGISDVPLLSLPMIDDEITSPTDVPESESGPGKHDDAVRLGLSAADSGRVDSSIDITNPRAKRQAPKPVTDSPTARHRRSKKARKSATPAQGAAAALARVTVPLDALPDSAPVTVQLAGRMPAIAPRPLPGMPPAKRAPAAPPLPGKRASTAPPRPAEPTSSARSAVDDIPSLARRPATGAPVPAAAVPVQMMQPMTSAPVPMQPMLSGPMAMHMPAQAAPAVYGQGTPPPMMQAMPAGYGHPGQPAPWQPSTLSVVTGERTNQPGQGHQRWIWLGTAGLALLAGLLAVGLFRLVRGQDSSQPASQPVLMLAAEADAVPATPPDASVPGVAAEADPAPQATSKSQHASPATPRADATPESAAPNARQSPSSPPASDKSQPASDKSPPATADPATKPDKPAIPKLTTKQRDELIKQMREHYHKGQYQEADQLCRKLWQDAPRKSDASVPCTLNACRLDAQTARRYYLRVPQDNRSMVQQACRKHGVELSATTP